MPLRTYGSLIHHGSKLQSAVLLILRLAWGYQLLTSGYGHLTHVQQTIEAFQGWGVPLPNLNVYISGTTELVGGALLILGLATRLIAAPLVFNFIVAIVAASRQSIAEKFTADGGFHPLDGWDAVVNDTAFPFLILALMMLAFGPGKASLDYLLQRTVFYKKQAEAQRADHGVLVSPLR